jgi:predicted ATP-grasp superfamily ATP-dependent carboligase
MRVFVTDGDQRPALAITRSLGRRGIEVIVGEARSASLASSSRYAASHRTYPSPYADPRAFDRFLDDLVARERVDVVIPVTDVTTYMVARRQNELREHTAVAAPPFEAFDFVSDKGRLLRQAATCGVSIPRTFFVDGATSVRRIVSHLEYPTVIKPCRSRIPTDSGWLSTMVHYASSKRDLLRLYDTIDYLASTPSMIQERVIGPGTGIFLLCDHGRLLTVFAHRRLREKPPSGGVSVLSESIPVDRYLRDEAMSLLGPLGWHGVAMVEYKEDRRTGRHVLMEVNGRFWGSLQLAVDAGIDFPYLCYRLALGKPIDLPPAYTVGVKSRWLLGDLDHLLIRLFGRRREGLPMESSRLLALIDFLRYPKRGSQDVFRRDDPRPMFHELLQYLRTSFGSKAIRNLEILDEKGKAHAH